MVDFLRIIGHGVSEFVEWVFPTPPPRPPTGQIPVNHNPDRYLIQQSARLLNLPVSDPERRQSLNWLYGLRPEHLAEIRRAQEANRNQSEAQMDELVGGTLLGMAYLVNAPLAFAATMTGLSYEMFHSGLQIPADQDTIVHAQSYLRNWSPNQSAPFPYQFIWEVDGHRNSNERQTNLFQARMDRFNQQVEAGKALLQQFPSEDPILQVSLLYQQLYGNSCVRNYDFYLNRPSRLFDAPRLESQRGCGNCDARAQAQLAYYLAVGVTMNQGNPPRYLFAAQHRSDHDELVVFDTHTRKVWNPMDSLGNAQSVLWENPAGDVYRIEYWMQAYLIGRDQHSPLSWENLILARSTAPASERGIANWDGVEASPFGHPPARQSASHGQTIPESEITPLPIFRGAESPPKIQKPSTNPFDQTLINLLRQGSFGFIVDTQGNLRVQSNAETYFQQAPEADQRRFLLRTFSQDLARMTRDTHFQALASIIEHPESMEGILSGQNSNYPPTHFFNLISSVISRNVDGMRSMGVSDDQVRLPMAHPFRRLIIRWSQWINRNPAFVAQLLSRIDLKSRGAFIDMMSHINGSAQSDRRINENLLSQIRFGTPLHDSGSQERNSFNVTATPAQPDEGPLTLEVNLAQGVSALDPRRIVSRPSPSPPTMLDPNSTRIPLDLPSIMRLIQAFRPNHAETNRIWTPQASREMHSHMRIYNEAFLLRILYPLVRTRFANQIPPSIRDPYLADRLNRQRIRPLLPHLSPEIRSLASAAMSIPLTTSSSQNVTY